MAKEFAFSSDFHGRLLPWFRRFYSRLEIAVGDFFTRGKSPQRVLEILAENKTKIILGNHDILLLATMEGDPGSCMTCRALYYFLRKGGDQLLISCGWKKKKVRQFQDDLRGAMRKRKVSHSLQKRMERLQRNRKLKRYADFLSQAPLHHLFRGHLFVHAGFPVDRKGRPVSIPKEVLKRLSREFDLSQKKKRKVYKLSELSGLDLIYKLEDFLSGGWKREFVLFLLSQDFPENPVSVRHSFLRVWGNPTQMTELMSHLDSQTPLTPLLGMAVGHHPRLGGEIFSDKQGRQIAGIDPSRKIGCLVMRGKSLRWLSPGSKQRILN